MTRITCTVAGPDEEESIAMQNVPYDAERLLEQGIEPPETCFDDVLGYLLADDSRLRHPNLWPKQNFTRDEILESLRCAIVNAGKQSVIYQAFIAEAEHELRLARE